MSVLRELILAFTAQDRKSTPASIILAVALSLSLFVVAHLVSGEPGRQVVLRVILVLVATAEFFGAIGQGLLTRSLFDRQGRPDHPLHRGAIQDFSLYNLAMAVALLLAGLDPAKNSVVINVYVLLSCLHGGVHLVRSARASCCDRGAEVRQGLPLLVAALAMVLFHP
jgi:hypothetical protein